MEPNWIYYIILMAITLAGGITGSGLSKTRNKSLLSSFLPFSGAFLLGILVLHMAPIVFGESNQNISSGVYVLLGFLIQLFLERFTQGLEHGHLHLPYKNATKFALFVMIGLCIHAFIEGLPLVHENLHHHVSADKNYLYALVLHKFPAALTLGILFKLSNLTKFRFYFYLILFSIMTPIGGIAGELLLNDPTYVRYATALVLGSFLHISTTIIFESDKNKEHRISIKKLAAILIGLGGAYLSVVLA